MQVARSLLFAATFYSGTLLCVVASLVASLFGRRPTLAVVLSWVELHHWLARHVLGIRVRVEGALHPGPFLIPVDHQYMYEAIEVVRVSHLPVIVMKRELADIPLFGRVTRRYGVIVVERSAGAKALRAMLIEGRAAIASGRPIVIYPEGTRVRVGETPPLRSGFAALYRALGLPVIPVAVDSGRLWGGGLVYQPGVVTFKIGAAIPPGLERGEIEARVHAAINALESAPQPSA
jgi:1-acyl-sn-glycerol-3-phosphate acyltransferase